MDFSHFLMSTTKELCQKFDMGHRFWLCSLVCHLCNKGIHIDVHKSRSCKINLLYYVATYAAINTALALVIVRIYIITIFYLIEHSVLLHACDIFVPEGWFLFRVVTKYVFVFVFKYSNFLYLYLYLSFWNPMYLYLYLYLTSVFDVFGQIQFKYT